MFHQSTRKTKNVLRNVWWMQASENMNHKIGNCMLSKSKILLLDFSCFCIKLFDRFVLYRQKEISFILKNFMRKIAIWYIPLVFWEQIWQICILLKKIDHSQFSLFSTVDFAKLLFRFFLVVSFSCCIAFQIGVWQQWKTRVFIKRFSQTWK